MEQKINWYGIFPYTEIIRTADEEPCYFALLFNDKLVAIGSEDEHNGRVLASVIFSTWKEFAKIIAAYRKNVIRRNNMIKHAKIVDKVEINKTKNLTKLLDVIKNKKFVSRSELPFQPKQTIYWNIFNNKIYTIYENKWGKPKRFSLWSGYYQTNIAKSNTLSDIVERLGKIVGQKIVL